MNSNKWIALVVSACVVAAILIFTAPHGSCVPQGITAHLVPGGTGQFPLGDPVIIRLVIKNQAAGPASILLPYVERFAPRTLSFAIRLPGAASYQPVEYAGIYVGGEKMLSPPTAIPVLNLSENQETNLVFQLDYDCPNVSKRRLLFPTAGRYSVKGEIFVLERSVVGRASVPVETPVKSLEVTSADIDILEPDAPADRTALDALRHLPFDYLLYAPDKFQPDFHPNAVPQIVTFAEANQASRYGLFGRFFLAFLDFRKAQGEAQVAQAKAAISSIAERQDAPIAFGFMRDKFVRQKEATSPAPYPFGATKAPVMISAVKELESQWYDVKGFTRRSPEGQRAYIDQVMPLNDQVGAGTLSQETFDLRHAEILKDSVRRFTKPLTPEEWRRRYDQYAAEEAAAAAQRAPQDEALKRRLIEQLERPAKPKP